MYRDFLHKTARNKIPQSGIATLTLDLNCESRVVSFRQNFSMPRKKLVIASFCIFENLKLSELDLPPPAYDVMSFIGVLTVTLLDTFNTLNKLYEQCFAARGPNLST